MKNIKVKYVNPNTLNPAAYNPRDISEHAFEGLKESIKKFGFVDPVIVNTSTGNLVGGHQRTKAAIALGLESIPMVEVELSPAEEKALNVTLNNQAISGHYTEGLQDLLQEIKLELPEFDSLLLNDLEINTDWNADLNAMDSIEPNLDGIEAKFTITCEQDHRDNLEKELKDVVAKYAGAQLKC